MNLLNLDVAQIVGLIASVIIPLVSAALSRTKWPQEITGILTLVVSTADGFFTEWAHAASNWDWKPALGQTIITFALAVAAHYGIWKGTQTQAKVLAFPAPKPAQPAPAPEPAPAAPPPAAAA